VVHARIHERLLDPVAIDRGGRLVRVLLDDREQVAEQAPLGRGQLRALDLAMRVRMRDAINGRTRGREYRGTGSILARGGRRSVLLAGPAQPPGS
jgi:hypothetical protein